MVAPRPRARNGLLALISLVIAYVATAGAEPANHRLLHIVALGDSTTARAADWAPEIREVYADCLPRRLQSFGIKAQVDNAGIGDTTTREALERLDRDVRSHRPDIVVVQFGINDSWIDIDLGSTGPRLTRAEFRSNLHTIIRELKADGSRVVLMTPNPMRWSDPLYMGLFEQHAGHLDTKNDRGIDRLLDVYADDVRAVASRERVPLVDVHRAFESYGNRPGQSVNDLLLAGDGIHPNQAGQLFVCRLLAEQIAKEVSHH